MTADDGLPPLREVIARHDLRARKSLGQNFLLDLNLTRRIARAAGPLSGQSVYEVGPGPGGLTRALLAEGAVRVVAIERDPRAIAALAEIAAIYPGRLETIEGDALTCDEPAIFPNDRPHVVANLPYNIGTPLLVRWMTGAWPPWWASLTLMFQREVADRVVARPGGKAYGRLSVLCQWRASPRILFNIPAAAFTPPPKVVSTVLQIHPTDPVLDGVDPGALESIVKAAFAQRRKMLRAALNPLTERPQELLEAAGINPEARAESVDVRGFCRLSRIWASNKKSAAPVHD